MVKSNIMCFRGSCVILRENIGNYQKYCERETGVAQLDFAQPSTEKKTTW